MNRAHTLLTLALALSWSAPAFAQDELLPAPPKDAIWRVDTARTLPAGRFEIGLFSPTRFGLTDSVELQTDLLLNLALPNLGVQVDWTDLGGWTLGSRHTLRYTTMLFSTLSAEGTGGFIPDNVDPPQMIELDNALLLTTDIGAWHTLTFDLGVSFVPQLTEGVTPSGSLPVVDFPFLYARTAAASGGATIRAGAAMSGALIGSLEYTADLDLYYNPAIFLAPVLEHGAELAWRISNHVSLAAGYRLTVAQYEYGARVHALPTLDLRVGF